jgi:hypothetical protein
MDLNIILAIFIITEIISIITSFIISLDKKISDNYIHDIIIIHCIGYSVSIILIMIWISIELITKHLIIFN